MFVKASAYFTNLLSWSYIILNQLLVSLSPLPVGDPVRFTAAPHHFYVETLDSACYYAMAAAQQLGKSSTC
jgi:hypothetical protein